MNRFGYGYTAAIAGTVFLLAFVFASLTCGDEVRAGVASCGWLAEADTNNPSLAMFPWGDPQYTDGGVNVFPRPPWALAAWMDGGLWITNDTWYGWQPGLGGWQPELATSRLLIHLDRALIASNLWIAVAGTGEPSATMLAGFYDQDLRAVSQPVVLQVSAAVPWFTNRIDLSSMPSASVVSLLSTNGMMRIFGTVLYQERAAQEDEGTSISACAAETSETAAPSGHTGMDTEVRTVVAGSTTNAITPRSFVLTSAVHPGPRIWHVDCIAGNDLHDGTIEVHVPSTLTGPKRTIAAALRQAVPGDTIFIAAGVYPERVRLSGVRLITKGRVVLQE